MVIMVVIMVFMMVIMELLLKHYYQLIQTNLDHISLKPIQQKWYAYMALYLDMPPLNLFYSGKRKNYFTFL